jgi:hypothetical protein
VYVKGVGGPFDGLFTVTAVTSTTFSFTTGSSGLVNPAPANGNVGYSIASEQLTNNVATITTTSPHRLSTNDWVYIFDAAKGQFNGPYQVTDVPTTTTFKFARTNADIGLTPEPGAGAWGGPITGTVSTNSAPGSEAWPVTCKKSSGAVTLHPGTYYGGICIAADPATGTACNTRTSTGSTSTSSSCTGGTADVTLDPGIYVMAGGGFWVCGASQLHAPNVLIYNTQDASHLAGDGLIDSIRLDTSGTVKLGPQTTGPYAELTIFQDRSLTVADVVCDSKSGDPSTAKEINEWDIGLVNMASSGPDGPLGSISGTIYAPHKHALFADVVGGTANLAVLTGCIFIGNNADSEFAFKPSGLFGSGTMLTE